jgi:hypothetical protein
MNNKLYFYGMITGIIIAFIGFILTNMKKMPISTGSTLIQLGLFIAMGSMYLFIILTSIDVMIESKLVSHYDMSLSMYQSVVFIILFGIYALYSPTYTQSGRLVNGYDMVITFMMIMIVFVGSKLVSKEMMFI